MRRQLHLDPIAWHQPHKIPFHRAHQVGQNPMLVFQNQRVHSRRPLFHDCRLDRPVHGLVKTHGPLPVTAMQCSKWAELEPSFVTAVQ